MSVPASMRAQRVLVVDDDPDARWLAAEALGEHGFDVSEADDGPAAMEQVRARRPDLVVLDLGLPSIGGLEILKWLRTTSDVAVIVVTGRAEPSDRVVGLELGADDYVVKPFHARELVARVRAVLRRGHPSHTERMDFGELVIDVLSRDVTVDGESVELTAKEFDVLQCLASTPRQVYSRTQLLDQVWGSSPDWQDPGTVNEHIYRLRSKIEQDPSNPRWITTMRGAGYRFVP